MKMLLILTALWAGLGLPLQAAGNKVKRRVNSSSGANFLVVPDDVHYVVSANVGDVYYGLPSVAFEGEAGKKNSWTVSAFFWPRSYVGYSYSQFGLGGSYRWWIASYLPDTPSRALRGIFIGPKVQLVNYNISYDYYSGSTKYNTSVSAFGFGAGAEAGYQYIFHPGLTVNAGVSAGYIVASANFQGGANYSFGGVYAGPVASVGWAF